MDLSAVYCPISLDNQQFANSLKTCLTPKNRTCVFRCEMAFEVCGSLRAPEKQAGRRYWCHLGHDARVRTEDGFIPEGAFQGTVGRETTESGGGLTPLEKAKSSLLPPYFSMEGAGEWVIFGHYRIAG